MYSLYLLGIFLYFVDYTYSLSGFSELYAFLCETSAFLVNIHGHRGPKGQARALGRLGPGPRGAWRGAKKGLGASIPGEAQHTGQDVFIIHGAPEWPQVPKRRVKGLFPGQSLVHWVPTFGTF